MLNLRERFFSPADIADHRGKNLCRDFCVNPQERKVFLRKSVPI